MLHPSEFLETLHRVEPIWHWWDRSSGSNERKTEDLSNESPATTLNDFRHIAIFIRINFVQFGQVAKRVLPSFLYAVTKDHLNRGIIKHDFRAVFSERVIHECHVDDKGCCTRFDFVKKARPTKKASWLRRRYTEWWCPFHRTHVDGLVRV